MQRLKKYDSPIIHFGYEEKMVASVLREKGYINDKSVYSEKEISDEYTKDTILTSVRFSVDSLVRRVCAKTVFNYLCWCNSS